MGARKLVAAKYRDTISKLPESAATEITYSAFNIQELMDDDDYISNYMNS